MKFRDKIEQVLCFNPDLVIIPECENLDKLKWSPLFNKPNDMLWYGKNPHKGIGIFSFSGYSLKLHEWHNPDFKMILPILVSNEKCRFNLFAIWANNPQDPDFQYIGQVWKALNHYENYLNTENTILIGDFNSNSIWDKPRRKYNHTTVVDFLKTKNIHSLYHAHFDELQAQESQPTFYLYRHVDKPYHIDYCFVSEDLKDKMVNTQVGKYEEWKHLSDHMPLVFTFEL